MGYFQYSLISSVILLNILYQINAHVSLTFPPARKYNVDYLDSSGSIPPCGMPKDSRKTTLMAGSSFNITWHLGYPHQGSHRIEIITENGTQLHMLSSELESEDSTATKHFVTIPSNFTCTDCIIRLLRQSAELRNPFYWFWSCSDVDIVVPSKYKETCSGHGTAFSNGDCACNQRFHGHRCQYENECESSRDCNNGHGDCIDLGGTNLPKKQCFCKAGYHGYKCSKLNIIGNTPFPSPSTLTKQLLDTKFRKKILDKRVHLYWRVLETEIPKQVEFALYVNGTTWVGIGWRPAEFRGDCTRFPPSNGIPNRNKRQVRTDDAKLQNSTSGSVQDSSYYTLHPMSCTDVVLGAVRGRLHRIIDAWSEDISTPRDDSLWDGTDDILAAGGWENKGVTTLVFRKTLEHDHIQDKWNDWTLEKPAHFIWARGQEHGEYVHSLPSGLDNPLANKPSIPLFYVQDEFKYHGFNNQRGSTIIDFING